MSHEKWYWHEHVLGDWFELRSAEPNGEFGCVLHHECGWEIEPEHRRLIAAAPDLLEACDEADTAFAVLNIGSDHGITPQATAAMRAAWAKINAAMAKAKGTTDRFAEANAEEGE